MAEVSWRPAGCCVALVALHGCRQVNLWLEGSSTARTVAGIACSSGTAVVEPRTANEGCRGMTDVAIQRRPNVVGMHAYCGRAVVTRSAIVNDAGMVEGRGDEVASIVTNAAILAGGQMILRFPCGKTGVMT